MAAVPVDSGPAARALEARLGRLLGQEIATPKGRGVLKALEAGVALVLMDGRYAVAFALADLVSLGDEVCAVCGAPAQEWCAACGQPACGDHLRHGPAAALPTAYMLDKVLARLARKGSAAVPEAEVAYAAAALAKERRLGRVEVVPAGKSLRLVLTTA